MGYDATFPATGTTDFLLFPEILRLNVYRKLRWKDALTKRSGLSLHNESWQLINTALHFF